MQEKELKISLKENEYKDLIKKLSSKYEKSIKLQENYYFDTLDYKYLKSKEMLRVRKLKDKTILTIKRNAQIKNGYFQCEEIESEFISCAWENLNLLKFIIDKDQSNILLVDNSLNFISLGCLKNLRVIFQTKDFKLEIDQSIFSSDCIDYELECETLMPEKLLEFLEEENLLKKNAIIFQSKSKFKRFLDFHKL